ncbi:MAG: regulatory protein RecX [Candidatus Saccharibacteria bacterium]|nr:regulatory protein RecX [Candidatus Saccharibacteria bacterium]
MKISNIKQQVKRPDRYSVYVDEKYTCSFSERELLNLGLRVGQELSAEDLEALKNDAVRDKAYDRSLNLIMRRPRSEWEIRDYLKRNQYDPEIIDDTVDHLNERGYLSDLDFAKRWVESRRLLKSTSKRRLNQELKQKRVSDDIISQVLEEDETDELEVLKDLVERKRKQLKYRDDLKLMQYLSRQGFSYDQIKQAIEGRDLEY